VIVVVAEDGHDRDGQATQFVGQDLRLARAPAAREVSADEQDVGPVGKVLEARS